MGRFHRHDDGTEHSHSHDADEGGAEHSHDDHTHSHHEPHEHPHDDDTGSTHDTDHLGDHSGYETGTERIQVLERIFDENDAAAARNLALFDAAGVVAVNLMSSPGSGKTSVLGRTLDQLQGVVRCGVIEGDIETSIDADRLRGYGAQISLLNTGNGFGGECHLDAPMVARAITGLNLDDLDLVLVENVGNLVCPAEFDVGAHRKAMVYSVTEGEDKPLKYPVMFRSVDVVIVNKIDLLPYLDFDLALFESNLRLINPTATVIHTSAKTGEGITEWVDWLIAGVALPAAAAAAGTGREWQ
ncbi:hydrogenase nickel incorporation protein HypB [Subtercola sp. PAMC28395]|uniref:hydrogenase nickel incorporation protein HypB n=1 Tax=Subtercola sp. PAMC28395 TaxID=2846775 RepID=UPI001C0D0807|nr:hydrogenase nickel incorporation protein HypB [Subtercola sp. PAMC28395]QWT23103.1 hydrogenase nickel incorporation protein HypB [Subtercola sp. PAMC28395]